MFLIGIFGVLAAFSDMKLWREFDTTGLIIVGFGTVTIIGIILIYKGLKVKMKNAFK